MRYNVKDASEAIVKGHAFTTKGSLVGIVTNGGLAVYSYAEPIAFIDPEKWRVHLNERRYTNTTSRHQGQARRAAGELQSHGYEVDRWSAEQFEEVTGLSTLNRNPFYTFY